MGQVIELTAADGHRLSAHRAAPQGAPSAGLVLIQEIFGVNGHIRDVAERYAAQGYLTIAPALFDRYQPGFETGYSAEDMAAALQIMGKLDWDKALLDVDAGLAAARSAGRVGAVGYCFGGSMAWLTACRLKADAAVCYYGGQIERFKDEQPLCPVIMHMGRKDEHIPASAVEAIHTAHPDTPIYLYDAGHGFSCDQRASFDRTAHQQAWERTLVFFGDKLV